MSRPGRRYDLRELSSALRAKLARLAEYPMSEPHRVSESIAARSLRVRTSDRITHAAWPEFRSHDDNDAFTLCGLRVHHCDLQRCRHVDRHKTRLFSAQVKDDATIDCMTCLTRQARQESE